MSPRHYERLSALDATFLAVEDDCAMMHVGAVAVFECGPLARPDGGIDIDRIRALVESLLIPRYRQRIERIPLSNHPVWVDDAHFNLHYHVRHLALPAPGDERLLKRLAGHVMSLPLDRRKPLWELWIVEGLAGGRFAIVTKTHHCMIDGVGSADLMTASMSATADPGVARRPATTWRARPAPTDAELLAGEVRRNVGAGLAALGALPRAVFDPLRAARGAWGAVSSVGEALGASLHRASATSLNAPIGPHRRFDWLRFDLGAVKEAKGRLGGTVNDVVLAVVSGALRRFLDARGEDVDTLDFRAMIPVNVRAPGEAGALGNRIAMLAAPLPLDEASPLRRFARIAETTRELKASRQAHGVELLEELSDFGLGGLFAGFARLAALSRPYNVVVTNVPGPQIQAYLLGAPLVEAYPLVPLYRNQALGIALFSYHGSLFWGLNADWDLVPDLHELALGIAAEFDALRAAPPRAPRPRRKPRTRKPAPAEVAGEAGAGD